MRKIWILYICTGAYDVFWKDFYLSAEQNLLGDENYEKHYFVFTDKSQLFESDQNPRIHLIPHEHLGRPNATLMRFHTFLSQKENLEKMEYLYFFNANLKIQTKIWSKEFLPYDQGLVFVRHPWFFDKAADNLPYERNPSSKAYIPFWGGGDYVQGALIWGSCAEFLDFCQDCQEKTDLDIKNNLMAIWHDESHLNAYLYHAQKNWKADKIRILSPSYLCPDNALIPFLCKILIIDKGRILNITKIKSLNPEPRKITLYRWIGYFLFPIYQFFLKIKQKNWPKIEKQ